MNSVFHEPRDKFLLAGQAAHLACPAEFPRFFFYTCAGKKNSMKINGVNPPFCGRNPLKRGGGAGGRGTS